MLLSILSGLIFSIAMGIITIKNPTIQNFIPVASLFVSAFILFSTVPFCLLDESLDE